MTRERSSKLGRGLAALLGDHDEGGVQTDLHEVAIQLLEPNPHQPRGPIDAASLSELTASIRSQGVLQPLLVRPSPTAEGHFQIVAGERRWRAAEAAGLQTIPCVVQPLNDQQSATAAMVENLQRLDLNAIEEAEGFERLLKQFPVTQDDVAEVVGKSRSHIANTLRLLRLPKTVQSMVRSGALSAGHARAVLSHPDPVAAADQIVARGLSVRQAEAITERVIEPRPDRDLKEASIDISAIEKELTDQLGLVVKLRSHDGRGSLTLRFSRLEQLDYIIGRLGPSQAPG